MASSFDPAVERFLPIPIILGCFAITYAICWILLPGGWGRLHVIRSTLAHLIPGRGAPEG